MASTLRGLMVLALLGLFSALANAANPTQKADLVWAKGIGGTADDGAYRKTAVLPNGEVLMSGIFRGSAVFGLGEPNQTTLISSGDANSFIAHFASDGKLIWAKVAGRGSSEVLAGQFVATSDGGCVLNGTFNAPATFGSGEANQTTLPNSGGNDVFTASFNSDGSLRWARGDGGPGDDIDRGMDRLADDSVLITGQYGSSAVFGAGQANQTILSGASGRFLAKYDSTGNLVWARKIGPATDSLVAGLSDNYSMVVGRFSGTITIGAGEPNATTITAPSSGTDLFLARYDADGRLVWVKQAGRQGGSASVWSIDSYSDDGTIITGNFAGSMTFGQGEVKQTTITSAGGQDVFIARFAPNGQLSWARRDGGTQDDLGLGVVVSPDGGAVVTGIFNGTAVFGLTEANATTLISAGDTDIFLAGYRADGSLKWARRDGGSSQDYPFAVDENVGKEIVITGFFRGTSTMGLSEPNEKTLTAVGGSDILVAKYQEVTVAPPEDANLHEMNLLWAKRIGGAGSDVNYSVTALPNGESYVTGQFSDSITLGAGELGQVTLTSTAVYDTFLAHYRADGTLDWAHSAQSGADMTRRCRPTSDGGALISGSYLYGPITFAAGTPQQTTLLNSGGNDGFVARYGATGTLLWARRISGPSDETNQGLDVLPSDGALVSGTYSAGAVFGPGEANQTTLSNSGCYVAQYASNGNLDWVVPIQGGADCCVRHLSSGGIMISGNFNGSLTLDAGGPRQTVLNAVGNRDMYIARLDASGHVVWARQAGKAGGFFSLRSNAVYNDQSTLVSGDFTGSVTFGLGGSTETTLTSFGAQDAFLARYDGNGNLMWARHAGGTGYDLGMEVVFRGDGGAYLVGAFTGTATFGPGEAHQAILTSVGGTDIYVAAYQPDGNLDTIQRAGSSGDDLAYALGVDAAGNAVISGMFYATATFGQGQPHQTALVSAGSADIFIAKYGIASIQPSVEVVAPNGGETVNGGEYLEIHWKTDVLTAGTGVKLELWNAAGWMADLGYGWSSTGETTSNIYLPLMPLGSDYRIRAISTWNSSLHDDSDGSFTIVGGPVRVDSPLGGETWTAGSRGEIAWTTNPLISGTAVQLEIWRHGAFVAWLGIDYNPQGHNVYEFKVPALASGADYRVRAISQWDSTMFDESGPITIVNNGALNAADEGNWARYR